MQVNLKTFPLVPTLCVVMPSPTLRVTTAWRYQNLGIFRHMRNRDAECPGRHSPAECGNENYVSACATFLTFHRFQLGSDQFRTRPDEQVGHADLVGPVVEDGIVELFRLNSHHSENIRPLSIGDLIAESIPAKFE